MSDKAIDSTIGGGKLGIPECDEVKIFSQNRRDPQMIILSQKPHENTFPIRSAKASSKASKKTKMTSKKGERGAKI
jgi:hypothetical protein